MTEQLEADYLVIGSGAMGMAFTDELLTQNPQTTVILVDRHAKPGGHWNNAYPFVSLHQPAAYYGVNSEKLGTGGAALASGTAILCEGRFNRGEESCEWEDCRSEWFSRERWIFC